MSAPSAQFVEFLALMPPPSRVTDTPGEDFKTYYWFHSRRGYACAHEEDGVMVYATTNRTDIDVWTGPSEDTVCEHRDATQSAYRLRDFLEQK